MGLIKELEKELDEILEFLGLFRPRHVRTERIGIVFQHHHPKEKHYKMAAPTSPIGTTTNGTPLFAILQPLQSTGANSNGVVSAASFTLADTSVVGVTSQGASASGVVFAQLTPLKIGSTILTATCTVTDPDGTVNTFTATANVVVTAAAGDVLTASITILFSATQPA